MDQQSGFTDNMGLTHHFSHDNLHISLASRFDPPQASALIELLHCNQTSCKRIFIDVRGVDNPHPSAVDALKTSLLLGVPSADRIIFKGKSGFAMAVNGNRVLVEQKKQHVCKGNCANCTCGHHKNHTHN